MGTLTKIQAPVFMVDGHLLNEYELRNLQVEIAKGMWKDHKLTVTDSDGNVIKILPDGRLEDTPKGLDLISGLLADMYNASFN